MAIQVGIAELKARLSHYIRLVREGEEVVIKDRNTPVARLSAAEAPRRERLTIIRPTKPLDDLANIHPTRPKGLKPGALDRILRDMKSSAGERWYEEWRKNRGKVR